MKELPALSDSPLSYSRGVGVNFLDPTTQERLRDDITNLQVVTKKAVPEPNSILGILAFGIAGVGLQLKRKKNTLKPLAI
jgi:hypothetical protein